MCQLALCASEAIERTDRRIDSRCGLSSTTTDAVETISQPTHRSVCPESVASSLRPMAREWRRQRVGWPEECELTKGGGQESKRKQSKGPTERLSPSNSILRSRPFFIPPHSTHRTAAPCRCAWPPCRPRIAAWPQHRSNNVATAQQAQQMR